MTEFSHGGDIRSAQSQYGGEILDFSANLNPLGMPEAVRLAAQDAVAGSGHYPDPFCRELVRGLSKRDGVPPEYILCGNGAADLIFRLVFALRPQTALITAPAFSEYEQALSAGRCEIRRHYLTAKSAFSLHGDILEKIQPGLDVLFLCNPNNPTGRTIAPGLLEVIAAACARSGTLLALDECFLELTDGGGNGMAHRLESNPCLLLLRAFTKSYAMAGLRLGYCLCSNPGLLEKLSRSAQPWSVSTPAQAAGLAALRCPEHPAAARALIKTERDWLSESLRGLGLIAFPSSANYILFRAEGIFDLKQRLISEGVLIRSCANYVGLGRDYYRIAVRPHRENELLIKALKNQLEVSE